jgi:hypothetical protein
MSSMKKRMSGSKSARHAIIILAALIPTVATSSPRVTALPEPVWIAPSAAAHALYTIRGRLTLIDDNLAQVGSACSGQGDHADIHAGTKVTVTDADGRVIGVGALGAGRPGEIGQEVCHFEFEIDGIPEVPVYRIGLERHGSLRYSLVQMKLQNWSIQLQLRG